MAIVQIKSTKFEDIVICPDLLPGLLRGSCEFPLLKDAADAETGMSSKIIIKTDDKMYIFPAPFFVLRIIFMVCAV